MTKIMANGHGDDTEAFLVPDSMMPIATRRRNRRLYLIIAFVVAIVVIIAIAVPLSLRNSNEANKVALLDCYPEAEGNATGVDEELCRERNCDYDRNAKPACTVPSKSYMYSFEETKSTESGFVGKLTNVKDKKDVKWTFGVDYYDDNVMRFYIDSEDRDRYKVPVPLQLKKKTVTKKQYEFSLVSKNPLAFQIIRKETGTKVWNLLADKENGLVLSNQLLQISTRLPSTNVYGLGEHTHTSFKHQMNGVWPSFARDQPSELEDHTNLYGVHPFYTCVEDDHGNTHGVLMFNSNAQEYAFTDMPSLKFRTFGGILDFYIFMGPTPEDVIQQYTQVIGRPVMPPYWALGFQLGRYGYNSLTDLKSAVESTQRYNIPHDVQYVDIDHMDKQKIFTVHEDRFPGLNGYFHYLQAGGMKIIYLLNPSMIATEEGYEPYERVKEVRGEVKWQEGVNVPSDVVGPNKAILGYVWTEGKVIFPDFFKNVTQDVWVSLIKNYRSKLTFDGLWIDMNEPANFGTNLQRPWNWPKEKKPYWALKCPKSEMEDPFIRPKAAYKYDERKAGYVARISDNTICMSTVQGNQDQYKHYDVHSLYGWSHTVPTHRAVKEATGTRSIVISRSTFPGSGTMAGHWLGDNHSTWRALRHSIIGMLEFNLFGIPYIGADICGVFGDTDPQLCKRWMQLGAFYPFCRNHNAMNVKNQGPGQLGDDVGNASREILLIRYKLLPYLYTLFHHAHIYGSTVVRPLHHLFPNDKQALSIDRQFLWGSCLLISPILEKDAVDLRYYLPGGVWYNYYTADRIENATGSWNIIKVTSDSMPELHIKGGCVLVEQEPANNTYYSRKNPLSLLVALDENKKAEGSFFWDDGVAIESYEKDAYFFARFKIENAKFTMKVEAQGGGNPDWQNLAFDKITIMGVIDSVIDVEDQRQGKKLSFTQITSYLEISLSSPIVEDLRISWRS